VENLAKIATAWRRITCVHDGADLAGSTLLDIQATQSADEIGLRRETGDYAFLSGNVTDKRQVAAVTDPRFVRIVERSASRRPISRNDHPGNLTLGVCLKDAHSQANVSLAVVRNIVHAVGGLHNASECHVAAVVNGRLEGDSSKQSAARRRSNERYHDRRQATSLVRVTIGAGIDTERRSEILEQEVENHVPLVIQADGAEETELERTAARRKPVGAPQLRDLTTVPEEDRFATRADVGTKGDVATTVEAARLEVGS
jgi:hypothetical protein